MGLIVVFNVLILIEVLGKTKFHCDCSALRGRHYVSWLLFTEFVLQAAIGILFYYYDVKHPKNSLVNIPLDALITAISILYFRRWWRHTKNKKKKLEKILSKVKVTAAGLKVIPHNARTSL